MFMRFGELKRHGLKIKRFPGNSKHVWRRLISCRWESWISVAVIQ